MTFDGEDEPTQETQAMPAGEAEDRAQVDVQSFHLEVFEGVERTRLHPTGNPCAIGSHPSNDIVIDHPTVSRFHCEIEIDERGGRVRDRASLNGTFVDGTPVADAWLREGSVLRLGAVSARFGVDEERLRVALSTRERFGSLVGRSVAMSRVFAVLERCAQSDATVLLQGETGVGKELAAEAIHEASPRARAPFVAVDCASLPPTLLETELFGHERGAFTGATEARVGAFEAADGGTVFLDEIGELPLHLQPKLLRVLESRTVRRVGSNAAKPVDVRIVAATHRPLHAEVNEGRFRPDLYYRLAVVEVAIPPLRDHLDDIPILVAELLDRLDCDASVRRRLCSPASLVSLSAHAWPGNVRQLRNHLERTIVLEGLDEPAGALGSPTSTPMAGVDARVPWTEARKRALAAFERTYLEALLARHGGNVSRAARSAEIAREYLHRLLRRHGISGDDS